MTENSEISASSQSAPVGALIERASELRMALVPPYGASLSKVCSLDQLGRALAYESDVAVFSGARSRTRVIHREIELWNAMQRAQVLVVQVNRQIDMALRWFPALLIARLNGKSIIGLIDFESTQFQKPIVRLLIRKLLAKADTLVTSTEWQAGGLRKIGLTAHVIPPVQAPSQAQSIASVQPHLCVTVDKDQLTEWDRIVQSFTLVKQKYPRAEMTVRAARELHTAIYEKIASAGASASQSIHIIDQSSVSQVSPGDLVISLDRDSEFPRQLVSAWSSGRPALVPAYSLVSSIVRDNFNGVIYSTASLAGLADATIRLIEKPELVQGLSTQGLKEAQTYQWESLRTRWRPILFTKK